MTVSVTVHVTGQNGAPDVALQTVCSDSAIAAVLMDFNPTANPDVAVIKALCAALITRMQDVQGARPGQGARNAAIAITEIEGAQMRAVKALFAK